MATGDVGAPRSHRVWPAQVIEWLKSAGFGQVQQTWQDENSYLVEAQ